MGRTVAVTWHVASTLIAAGLFFFFVIPRWPELMGETSPTLGTVLRIVTGVLVALTALPVVFTLLRTRRPELGTPELALRLRTTSIVFHVLAGVLIVGTAIAEIWVSLDSAGSWLFGIYGAAAALALLGAFGFYLAFIAELPPPPPKPVKPKVNAVRRNTRAAKDTADADEIDKDAADEDEAGEGEDATERAEDSADEPSDDTAVEASDEDADQTDDETEDATSENNDEPRAAEPESKAVEPESTAVEAESLDGADTDDSSGGKLRNRRPSNKANKANKGGSSRFRRRSRGGITVEE